MLPRSSLWLMFFSCRHCFWTISTGANESRGFLCAEWSPQLVAMVLSLHNSNDRSAVRSLESTDSEELQANDSSLRRLPSISVSRSCHTICNQHVAPKMGLRIVAVALPPWHCHRSTRCSQFFGSSCHNRSCSTNSCVQITSHETSRVFSLKDLV